MLKTIGMLAALAVFTGASVACFGLLSGGRDDRERIERACDGLTGQARVDCERQQTRE